MLGSFALYDLLRVDSASPAPEVDRALGMITGKFSTLRRTDLFSYTYRSGDHCFVGVHNPCYSGKKQTDIGALLRFQTTDNIPVLGAVVSATV